MRERKKDEAVTKSLCFEYVPTSLRVCLVGFVCEKEKGTHLFFHQVFLAWTRFLRAPCGLKKRCRTSTTVFFLSPSVLSTTACTGYGTSICELSKTKMEMWQNWFLAWSVLSSFFSSSSFSSENLINWDKIIGEGKGKREMLLHIWHHRFVFVYVCPCNYIQNVPKKPWYGSSSLQRVRSLRQILGGNFLYYFILTRNSAVIKNWQLLFKTAWICHECLTWGRDKHPKITMLVIFMGYPVLTH